jgi:hypothetical protein
MRTVKDIIPSKRNPRTIDEKRLEMLGKSMREFGDLSGVVFNRRTNRLIGGHQRLKHLDPKWRVEKKDASDDVGTVSVGHIETPFGKWSYREVDWEESKELAANLAANKHGGEFDVPMLKELILELDTGETDMETVGFSFEEIERMMTAVPPENAEAKGVGNVGDMTYNVVVECNGESEQVMLLERFKQEGLKCRPLML